MNIDGLVEKAREALANVQPVTKYVALGGEMVGVRFTPIGGDEWRDLTAQFLPRTGSFFDQNLGFNVDATTRSFPGFSIVTDEGVDDLKRVGEDDKVRYIWPDIFRLLDAPAIEIIAQALWEAHQAEPLKRLVEAGKALRAGRQKKPSSPGNSASQSES